MPQFLKDNKIPAGYVNSNDLKEGIMTFVKDTFGDSSLIENISNQSVYFDYQKLGEANVNAQALEKALYYYLLQQDKVDKVFTRQMIEFSDGENLFTSSVKNGFHPKRSGDVMYVLEPSHIDRYSKKGTTHGSYYSYDTQAPLFFYGKGIVNKTSYKPYHIKDIAPTIAAMLGITQPNGTTGQVIEEAIQK